MLIGYDHARLMAWLPAREKTLGLPRGGLILYGVDHTHHAMRLDCVWSVPVAFAQMMCCAVLCVCCDNLAVLVDDVLRAVLAGE